MSSGRNLQVMRPGPNQQRAPARGGGPANPPGLVHEFPWTIMCLTLTLHVPPGDLVAPQDKVDGLGLGAWAPPQRSWWRWLE